MLPALVLRAATGPELLAAFALALLLVVSLVVTSRLASPDARIAALFAAYFSGALLLVLSVHAAAHGAPLVISSYAATLVFGVLASWALAVPRLRALGLSRRMTFYVLFGCLAFGIVGSRIANVLGDLAEASRPIDVVSQLRSRDAGLGVFGAFALDTIFLLVLFRRVRGHAMARFLDGSASIIAFNISVGRIGCLFAGCCYGAATTPGVFTLSASAFQPDSPAGAAYRGYEGAVWATQPIEALAVLGLAFGCEWLYRARVRGRLVLPDGAIIVAGAGTYGAVRALIELGRADSARVVAGIFTVWQTLGIAMLLGATGWMALALRPKR